MNDINYLNSISPEQLDVLYQQFQSDPQSVEASWQRFFEGFEFGSGQQFKSSNAGAQEYIGKEFNVINLINGYRSRGHLFTDTNPVRERRKYFPTLDIENFGLSTADLE